MISAFDKNNTEQQESSAAVEIKPRSTSFNAPTPANTPLSTAPISQKQFKASLAAMSEMPNAASVQAILSQNPQLAAALQGRLGQLVGESSGYVDSLPVIVKKRVTALESLQKKHLLLEKEFDVEVAALEKKYEGLYQPLYTRRAEIAKGTSEPTPEEIAEFQGEEDGVEAHGIPEFWLSILKNSPVVQQLVTEVDESALKHLIDIRSSYLESNPGFRLEFEFEENDYFTDKVLTKTYYLTETEESSSLMFDHCDGCEINWKSGRDLTVKVEIKKQRHKNSNKTRVVKKTVPNETFFNFFKAPVAPEEGDEEDEDEDGEDGEDDQGEDAVQADYEMAEHFKDNIIPEAVDWFTGKATKKFLEQYDDGEDYDDEDEEDFDEDEDEDDDEDEAPPQKSARPARIANPAANAAGAAASPECKQQ